MVSVQSICSGGCLVHNKREACGRTERVLETHLVEELSITGGLYPVPCYTFLFVLFFLYFSSLYM